MRKPKTHNSAEEALQATAQFYRKALWRDSDTHLEPDDQRRMVRQVIEQYLPADQLQILKTAEASEREIIAGLVGGIAGGAS